MIFGRCFEKALGAYFCQEDCAAVLFKEWESFASIVTANVTEGAARNNSAPHDALLLQWKGYCYPTTRPSEEN